MRLWGTLPIMRRSRWPKSTLRNTMAALARPSVGQVGAPSWRVGLSSVCPVGSSVLPVGCEASQPPLEKQTHHPLDQWLKLVRGLATCLLLCSCAPHGTLVSPISTAPPLRGVRGNVSGSAFSGRVFRPPADMAGRAANAVEAPYVNRGGTPDYWRTVGVSRAAMAAEYFAALGEAGLAGLAYGAYQDLYQHVWDLLTEPSGETGLVRGSDRHGWQFHDGHWYTWSYLATRPKSYGDWPGGNAGPYSGKSWTIAKDSRAWHLMPSVSLTGVYTGFAGITPDFMTYPGNPSVETVWLQIDLPSASHPDYLAQPAGYAPVALLPASLLDPVGDPISIEDPGLDPALPDPVVIDLIGPASDPDVVVNPPAVTPPHVRQPSRYKERKGEGGLAGVALFMHFAEGLGDKLHLLRIAYDAHRRAIYDQGHNVTVPWRYASWMDRFRGIARGMETGEFDWAYMAKGVGSWYLGEKIVGHLLRSKNTRANFVGGSSSYMLQQMGYNKPHKVRH